MKRYSPQCNDYQCANVSMEWDPAGKWVAHSAHVALLARIRAAVEVERSAAWEAACWADEYDYVTVQEAGKARDALDALLADGGA